VPPLFCSAPPVWGGGALRTPGAQRCAVIFRYSTSVGLSDVSVANYCHR